MADVNSREKELVLAPNEYAFISDKTKGNVVAYVGPHKVSLSGTDSPVIFDYRTKRFMECSLERAIQVFATAPEGWYLILKNPAVDDKNIHPRVRSSNDLTELRVGRKVNIPGPDSFPLWPGQMVKTVQGHNLRSNQYLVVRVYDDVAAKENWKSGVIKSSAAGTSEMKVINPTTLADDDLTLVTPVIPITPLDLTMGNLLVIKGTEVSFYIPPTGVEVVSEGKDDKGRDTYVRDAVTLERLEYCILRDENGNKRYVQGPAVVFPEPTEVFLEKGNSRKYKAVELSETSGIYIKVIADYMEGGTEYKTGDEVFITGRNQMIYFPRPEHAIIKYNNQIIHHAIAIPPGEARYVLSRETGDVFKKLGPCMFLPDPRKEVIVRRVLSAKQVSMWFPGNNEAMAYNADLANLSVSNGGYVPDNDLKALTTSMSTSNMNSRGVSANSFHMEDGFDRKASYTPPRSITLDTKYDGAVAVNVWTGYAIQVVSKLGNRKVIVGPTSYLLEYDETLELMELSTGKPKTTDKLLKTVYLRALNNKIGDIITVQTKDYCDLQIKVSYCVNFEGDKDKWFNAENYVKLLCDHMRSKLRSEAKEWSIQDFYSNSTALIKDTVLGFNPEGSSPGYAFKENGMKVYDVEVLGVRIMDGSVADALVRAQQEALDNMLNISKLRQKLAFTTEQEFINQQFEVVKAESVSKSENIRQKALAEKLVTDLLRINNELETNAKNLQVELEKADGEGKLYELGLLQKSAFNEVELARSEAMLEQRISGLQAEALALKVKSEAISPQLIAALANLGDKAMLEKIGQAVMPMAIVNDQSIADTIQKLFKGTALEEITQGITLSLNKS